MYQKLFQVTLVFFLAVVSVAFFTILFAGVMSLFQSTLLAGVHGFTFAITASAIRRFTFLLLAATLLICGVAVLWRRHRRLHR